MPKKGKRKGDMSFITTEPVYRAAAPAAMVRLEAAIMAYDLLEEAYQLSDQLYMDVHKPRNRGVGTKSPTQWHNIVDSISDAQLKITDEIVSLARAACQANHPREDSP